MKDRMNTTITLLALIAGLLFVLVVQNFAILAMDHRSNERHSEMALMQKNDMMDRAYDRYLDRRGYSEDYGSGIRGRLCPLIYNYLENNGYDSYDAYNSLGMCQIMPLVESNTATNIDGSGSVPMPMMSNLKDYFNEGMSTKGDTMDNIAGYPGMGSSAGYSGVGTSEPDSSVRRA